MQLKRTIFSVEISGVTYRFAEATMREIESLVASETAAFEAQDFSKIKEIHLAFVLNALNQVPNAAPITAEELKDNVGVAQFNTLYGAILTAQGIKLEAKNLGESLPSQSS